MCYLAQPGGLKVKIMSGREEGMWAGNNISLWNNPSVAVLSQRPLFMEILQMWSPLAVLREANRAGGRSSWGHLAPKSDGKAPKSHSLFKSIALLWCASAEFRHGFGDIFSFVLLAPGVSMQQLNRRKELIWFSHVKLKMKFLLAHPSRNPQWSGFSCHPLHFLLGYFWTSSADKYLESVYLSSHFCYIVLTDFSPPINTYYCRNWCCKPWYCSASSFVILIEDGWQYFY